MHLYVHVPFCDGRCRYCSFYSCAIEAPAAIAYAPLPARELELVCTASGLPDIACEGGTLYIGGGTPTALGTRALATLLRSLDARIDFARLRECTIEGSPQHITDEMAAMLADRGVTRVSLGAQSFDDAVLRAVGRRHSAAQISLAVRTLRAAGIRAVGLDLIAGLPGVDASRWAATIEAALDQRPHHLSVYALSIEPDSTMAREVRAGRLAPPDDDGLLEALALAEDMLGAHGYARYEISNYALEGHACRHNSGVWRGEDFLGLGPSAASRLGRERRTNLPDLAAYCHSIDNGLPPPAKLERLTPEDDITERFLTGLRLAEGVVPADRRWGAPGDVRQARRRSTLERLESVGLVEPIGSGWRLSARGREVADAVMRELV